MEDFKKTIYRNYVSKHTQTLYGRDTLLNIERQFPVWRYYFSRLLPVDKQTSILDIGCGDGGFVYFLQKVGYENANGIDVSLEQIESGHALGIKNIECADLLDFLTRRKEHYDCIIARDVMEHFTRQEIFEILAIVRSSLKPSGSFIIQSPNGEGMFYAGIFYGDFTHEIAFTASSLQQIYANTGFEQVECYPTGPVPKGLLSTIRWFIWQLIVLKIRVYKLVETGSGAGIFTQNLIAKATKTRL